MENNLHSLKILLQKSEWTIIAGCSKLLPPMQFMQISDRVIILVTYTTHKEPTEEKQIGIYQTGMNSIISFTI